MCSRGAANIRNRHCTTTISNVMLLYHHMTLPMLCIGLPNTQHKHGSCRRNYKNNSIYTLTTHYFRAQRVSTQQQSMILSAGTSYAHTLFTALPVDIHSHLPRPAFTQAVRARLHLPPRDVTPLIVNQQCTRIGCVIR